MTPDAISILLEEYRALYGLAALRMNALEQRALLAWGLVIGFWGAFESLGTFAQVAVLVGVPVLAPLLLHTTITHAQSSEDAFRRLDEIEREVNQRAKSNLLQFQSHHPSKGMFTGGRIGRSAVQMMTGALVVLLFSCMWAFSQNESTTTWTVQYALVIEVVLVIMARAVIRFGRYRYIKPASGEA